MAKTSNTILPKITPSSQIDVIITCYKYGHLLARAIDSVLAQTNKNINIIVIDDASPDNTELIAKRYSQVIYIKNSANLGCVNSMERGLKISTAPLVSLLDADDALEPDFAKTLLEALINNPTAAFAYSQIQYQGDKTHIYKSSPFSPFKLTHAGNYIGKTCLIRRAAFDLVGGFHKNMGQGQEDWDLWLSFIERRLFGVFVSRPLFRYTIHEASRNAEVTATVQSRKQNINLIRKNHPGLYNWRFWIIHPFYMLYWIITQKFQPS
ncbi:MAG: glycosyltransferase family 2 protein [Patescibacteria group bacterium]|nr:glycosyltransferase family 2 protein [Patescibacteria group bacterium]